MSVPATGDGISVSTLSVDTSSSGSSTSTRSPTCLSQRVTVPSVTLSPSSGIFTAWPEPVDSALAFGFSAGSSPPLAVCDGDDSRGGEESCSSSASEPESSACWSAC